ncbi:uncharacterized protein J7T54_005957 [Emericellopsis cladophorae]|uniref:Uncharacterized protein n=1 Tax=Emericellopsis cladophorae TaxID=2686198 RepID=A0A9P9Y8N0_9HYPO|nr:uncharacterized protein J7T54_005957 [Emericellopsis cladophorae]KAI6785623.1 hypothetical protein J7T54_005957 [Emericellopsis cladophorae]
MDTNLSKPAGKNGTRILLPEDQHGSARQTKVIICAIFIGLTIATLAGLMAIKHRKHTRNQEAMKIRKATASAAATSGKYGV